MYFEYETERLFLKVLDERDAHRVHKFYRHNIGDFELVEPLNVEGYSDEYFASVLKYEHEEIIDGNLLRYWVMPKEAPDLVIGTVSFRNFQYYVYQSCEVGYKIDKFWRKMGLAREMVAFGMALVLEELKLHRIEATVLPENAASMRLLSSLGFEREGYLRDKILINDVWRDHYLYAYVDG